MNLVRICLLLVFFVGCTTPETESSKGTGSSKLGAKKAKITEFFACFKYEDTPLEVTENNFIRLGSVVNGSSRQGYSTIHLYKRGKYNILGWIDYSCGPACEQTIKWYVVNDACKIKEISPKKFFPGDYSDSSRFLSLSRDGKEAYIVEADKLDVYNDYEMRIEEKYHLESGRFIKDDSFEPFSLFMTKDNVDQYFTHKEK
ncbi:MAG: hypothetical protein KDD37_06600 [Bdellovibrionales bacterium]|nr:hypothetical protein [Bdellovibrionales bacterium]